jgi:hypothetical protein
MKPSKETIKKLRKLQTFIHKEPRRFDMSRWGTVVKNLEALTAHCDLIDQDDSLNYDLNVKRFLKLKPPCNTMACLAGSALIMGKLIEPIFSDDVEDGEVAVFNFSDDTPEIAAEYLGLDYEDTNLLFYIDGWGKFASGFERLSPQKQVERACERIDHFIETGE